MPVPFFYGLIPRIRAAGAARPSCLSPSPPSEPPMRQLRPLALSLALLAPLFAHADVYKCVDAEGRTTYTNDRNLARNCKLLEQGQAVSSVPPPPPRQTAPAQSTSPSSFPRVSADTQRARDNSRREVLEGELAAEEKSLAAARQALSEQEAIRTGDERNYQKVLDRLKPYQDRVDLHQRNIEALRREIANLR